MSERIEVVGLL